MNYTLDTTHIFYMEGNSNIIEYGYIEFIQAQTVHRSEGIRERETREG